MSPPGPHIALRGPAIRKLRLRLRGLHQESWVAQVDSWVAAGIGGSARAICASDIAATANSPVHGSLLGL
eukprot:506004-Pleurochrysis_carterae.AAC.2